MNIEEVREHCLLKQEVEECFPFDEVTLVFKVAGKMFAVIALDNPVSVSLKCDPERAILLREEYAGVVPAYHFNKKHWNGVMLCEDVPPSVIKQLIDHSYSEVVKKLPKLIREGILLLRDS